MNHSSSKLFLISLALVGLAAFAVAFSAEAARGGGGGGGGGGGNRAASAGQQRTAQASNANADKRTNDVRNTSVNNVNVNNNNVNVNRNVNVNVQDGGCCNNGWDNDNPIAKAAAVTATVAVTSAVIGSMVRTVPPSCVPVSYGGMVYQQCGTTWYQAQGPQYIVVNPPY